VKRIDICLLLREEDNFGKNRDSILYGTIANDIFCCITTYRMCCCHINLILLLFSFLSIVVCGLIEYILNFGW
jgi:hypothetical protein